MVTKIIVCSMLVLLFLMLANTTVHVWPWPLRISMKTPLQAIGWIFIIAGVSCISYSDTQQAKADEHEKINKIIKQAIDEKRKEEVQNVR